MDVINGRTARHDISHSARFAARGSNNGAVRWRREAGGNCSTLFEAYRVLHEWVVTVRLMQTAVGLHRARA